MKREFKHRVWDGEIMRYPDYIDFRDSSYYPDYRALEDGRELKTIVPPMEFLGFKDRNGIELYERDIVRDNVGRLWIPVYNQNTLSIMFEYVKDRKQKQEYARFNEYQRPFEWIGNEFEHPHLLKPTFESNTLPK